jgi:hypothetical protein
MMYIVLIAVIGVVLFQSIAAVPLSGIGGAMVIGWVLLIAVPAVGIHEAWTKKRGVLGWIVNIIVSLVGALLFAPIGGMILAILLSPFKGGARTLADAGGLLLLVALVGMTVVALMAAKAALWIVNRWR